MRMADYVADLTDCASAGTLQPVDAPSTPNGVTCKQIANCPLARLCEYEERGHEALPGSLAEAWGFLNAAVQSNTD